MYSTQRDRREQRTSSASWNARCRHQWNSPVASRLNASSGVRPTGTSDRRPIARFSCVRFARVDRAVGCANASDGEESDGASTGRRVRRCSCVTRAAPASETDARATRSAIPPSREPLLRAQEQVLGAAAAPLRYRLDSIQLTTRSGVRVPAARLLLVCREPVLLLLELLRFVQHWQWQWHRHRTRRALCAIHRTTALQFCTRRVLEVNYSQW